MRHVRPRLPGLGFRRVATARSLVTARDRSTVAVAGLVIGRQRPQTASGVTFVTLEDETGVANLVVRLDVWEAHRGVAMHAKLLLARGRVEREGQVVHVLVRSLHRLDLAGGVAVPARSRDFH
jgi:error-prone DNA polymerase